MSSNPLVHTIVRERFLPALGRELAVFSENLANASASARTAHEITGREVNIIVPPLDLNNIIIGLETDIENAIHHQEIHSHIARSVGQEGS